MQFKLFSIPATGDSEAEEESEPLPAVAPRRVGPEGTGARRPHGVLVLLRRVSAEQSVPEGKGGGRPRVDYKEILSADDFAVFVRLREVRKELAGKEAIPVYAVCTNEQLAEMAKGRAATLADLKKIDGFGDAKSREVRRDVSGGDPGRDWEHRMKRAGNLIERIADADNLRLAFWKASKGKRAKAEVLRLSRRSGRAVATPARGAACRFGPLGAVPHVHGLRSEGADDLRRPLPRPGGASRDHERHRAALRGVSDRTTATPAEGARGWTRRLPGPCASPDRATGT